MTRAATVRAFPDPTGLAPPASTWHAFDTARYDSAPDARPPVVGFGSTAEAALADFDKLTEEIA